MIHARHDRPAVVPRSTATFSANLPHQRQPVNRLCILLLGERLWTFLAAGEIVIHRWINFGLLATAAALLAAMPLVAAEPVTCRWRAAIRHQNPPALCREMPGLPRRQAGRHQEFVRSANARIGTPRRRERRTGDRARQTGGEPAVPGRALGRPRNAAQEERPAHERADRTDSPMDCRRGTVAR